MVKIHEQIKTNALKTRMIIQIHDELVFDVLKEEMEEFVDLTRDKMENVLELDVPIKVDIKKGQNWLEMELA